MMPYIGLFYRDTISAMLNMKGFKNKRPWLIASLIAAMAVTLLAAVYLNLWLFDGCSDIQRIRDLPEWEQAFLDVTFWPVVACFLVVEFVVYRRLAKHPLYNMRSDSHFGR